MVRGASFYGCQAKRHGVRTPGQVCPLNVGLAGMWIMGYIIVVSDCSRREICRHFP